MAKFLDKTGLDTLWAKIKSTFQTLGNLVTAWGSTPSDTKYPSEKLVKTKLNEIEKKAYGAQGFISSSATNAEIFAERTLMGSWSLNNRNGSVRVQLYRYADGDEDNATLVWDSNTATGDVKEKFLNAKQTGTLLTTDPGECAKVVYTGSTNSYFRAIGIYLNVKVADGSHTVSANLRIGTTNYPTYSVSTWGSLVTAIASDGAATSATVIFKPNQSAGKMLFYGFRCLNTYSEGGTLIGTSDEAIKLKTSRKLAVSLSNTSTDTTFNGSADVTNIKTAGTLGIGNGGTGATTARGAMYNTLGRELTLDSTLDGNRLVPIRNNEVSAANGVFRWFKLSNVWEYIKSQISSVLGLTATSYGGNAATATTAAGYSSGGAIDTALQGKQDDIGIEPSTGDASKFLNEKGAWVVPSGVDSAVFTISGTSITNEMYVDIIQAVSENKIVTLLRGATGNTLMYRLTSVDSTGGISASRSAGNSIYNISISPIADAHAVTFSSDTLALSDHTHGNIANDGTDGQETHDLTKFLRADGNWGVPPASYPPTGAAGKPVFFSWTGYPTECTMVGSQRDSILGRLHPDNLSSETNALFFCVLSQGWARGGYLTVGGALSKLTGLTTSAKGSSQSPIFWNGSGFDTGCTFNSAHVSSVGTSGNADSSTSTIYVDTILNVGANNYTYSINADRFIQNKPYKICWLKGTSSSQIKLYRPSTRSNINLYSGTTAVVTGKLLPLLGGTHGGSFTSTLIRTAENTFYLIWGY